MNRKPQALDEGGTELGTSNHMMNRNHMTTLSLTEDSYVNNAFSGVDVVFLRTNHFRSLRRFLLPEKAGRCRKSCHQRNLDQNLGLLGL